MGLSKAHLMETALYIVGTGDCTFGTCLTTDSITVSQLGIRIRGAESCAGRRTFREWREASSKVSSAAVGTQVSQDSSGVMVASRRKTRAGV